MSFDVGDRVVYPHHGAAVILRREFRNVAGTNREYLVLHMAYDDLTLSVPVDNADGVGLRDVIDEASSASTHCWPRRTRTPLRIGRGDSRTTSPS